MRIFAVNVGVVGLAALVCTQAVRAQDRLEVTSERVVVEGLLDDQGVIRVGAALGFMLPRAEFERLAVFDVPVRAIGQLLPGSRVMGQRTVFRLARAEVRVTQSPPLTIDPTRGLARAIDPTPAATTEASRAAAVQPLDAGRTAGKLLNALFEDLQGRLVELKAAVRERLRTMNADGSLSQAEVEEVFDLRQAAAGTGAFGAVQAVFTEEGGNAERAWQASRATGGRARVYLNYQALGGR